MIPKGLFTQIGMVIVSIAIIFAYVKPQLTKISDIQEKTETYVNERKKVVSTNSQLADLVGRMNSVTREEKARLYTYLPDDIDGIAVMRDLQLITQQAGVLLLSVDSSEDGAGSQKAQRKVKSVPQNDDALLPVAETFNLSVVGTYEQQRTLLDLLAQNNYLLEVQDYSVTRDEQGDLLTADITLASYRFKADPLAEN